MCRPQLFFKLFFAVLRSFGDHIKSISAAVFSIVNIEFLLKGNCSNYGDLKIIFVRILAFIKNGYYVCARNRPSYTYQYLLNPTSNYF